MCSGQQDALIGELVEPRTRNVGVTVDTEIPAQIMPMHEQHIVAALFSWLLIADYRHLLSLPSSIDVIGRGVVAVPAPSTGDALAASDSPMRRRIPARAGRALRRRLRLAVRRPLAAALKSAGCRPTGRAWRQAQGHP